MAYKGFLFKTNLWHLELNNNCIDFTGNLYFDLSWFCKGAGLDVLAWNLGKRMC